MAISIITPGQLTLSQLAEDPEVGGFVNENPELLEEQGAKCCRTARYLSGQRYKPQSGLVSLVQVLYAGHEELFQPGKSV